jgi:hypothetical protein
MFEACFSSRGLGSPALGHSIKAFVTFFANNMYEFYFMFYEMSSRLLKKVEIFFVYLQMKNNNSWIAVYKKLLEVRVRGADTLRKSYGPSRERCNA